MAFTAGGTNYQGFLEQRRRADEGVTSALKAKGEAEKAARIRKSGQRSGLQKLGSAVVRGAAAYYTGGMSETMGGGAMIDEAMLGTDEEGKAVRNEYGEMVGMASQIGGAMSAKKGADAAKKLEMQSLKDDAMQTRLDNLDPSGTAGREFAMNRSRKDADNLKALQAGQKGSLGGLFQKDIEGINYEPTTVGDWEMPPKPEQKLTTPDDASLIRGQVGYSEIKRGGDIKTPEVKSAALQSSPALDQRKGIMKQEQDDLISRLTDDQGRRQQSQLNYSGGTPPVVGKPWEKGYGEGFSSHPQFISRKSNEGWVGEETGKPWEGQ